MIHDASVEVTCDGAGCREILDIPLRVAYGGVGHGTQSYFDKDEDIEEDITKRGWLVVEGKHYCGEGCQPKPKTRR